MTDVFRNYATNNGYTYEEAIKKKEKVDDAHLGPNSRWNKAEIVPDERGGYKVIISTK